MSKVVDDVEIEMPQDAAVPQACALASRIICVATATTEVAE